MPPPRHGPHGPHGHPPPVPDHDPHGPGPGPHLPSHHRHRGGPARPLPASRALGFVDPQQLDDWLAPLVPDAADRRFVGRCLIGEGPIHHRGANFVLLALLARVLERAGWQTEAQPDGAPVPMRLPPHLAGDVEEGHYPLRLPLAALRELAHGDEQQVHAMVDCLTDGPPQHALANVVMVALLDRLLRGDPTSSRDAG